MLIIKLPFNQMIITIFINNSIIFRFRAKDEVVLKYSTYSGKKVFYSYLPVVWHPKFSLSFINLVRFSTQVT